MPTKIQNEVRHGTGTEPPRVNELTVKVGVDWLIERLVKDGPAEMGLIDGSLSLRQVKFGEVITGVECLAREVSQVVFMFEVEDRE